MLGQLNKCKYFSSLDLHSGYYHISLTEEAKKKTAFINADGKYQWNVVPFGLATAVSTFQYLMSTVLTGLNNFAFTSLDDVLVFSETYDDHLHHLNTVFEKFQNAGLKVKIIKCQFFKTHLHYLGHRISANGLEPMPEKLEAIKNLAPARNVDEVCQILGLLGYYRLFLPAFANITLPITSLLKKNTPFVWSDKYQLTLEYLKEIFCNKQLLQFLDPNKTYVLYTDASNNAYSGVLCQPVNNDQDIMPVAYFWGTFTAQNRSWCATEKEAYGVLTSVQCFDYYLWGAKCTLCCNHKPLEPFLTRGMKIAKLDRWAMLLQEYDITFVHIRGKDNILTDAISRLHTIDIYEKAIETQHLPITQTTTTQVDEKVEQIQHVDSSQSPQLLNMNSTTLCTLQKQDRFCKNKVWELHSGIDSSIYLNTDSILKWTVVINNLEVHTTVVPLALTHTLLHKFHNCRGHQGCTRTVNSLKRKFWWKGMWRDVKYHISNCITCLKNLPNTSCHPQLHLEIPKVPFPCIAIDTIGKLPTTSSGNRYALTCIDLLTSYIIAIPMPDITAESVVEANVSGILSRATASVVCLSDNGSELKTMKWTLF